MCGGFDPLAGARTRDYGAAIAGSRSVEDVLDGLLDSLGHLANRAFGAGGCIVGQIDRIAEGYLGTAAALDFVLSEDILFEFMNRLGEAARSDVVG